MCIASIGSVTIAIMHTAKVKVQRVRNKSYCINTAVVLYGRERVSTLVKAIYIA